jgi:PAS domain S-box-containing protein
LSWPARLARAVDTATAALARARDNLEREVGERTRELRVANEALRQSEQRYRIFIDATSDMVFLKDEKLHHVVANRALATFLGREPRDVVGLDDFALMPADLAASCQDTDLQAIAGQATVTTLQSQGGRMFEVRKFPAPLGSGRTGVGGIIRDVTDRFRAEQAVRESESALRGLRDNAPVGIFTSTPDGRYLTVNACLARMYGYTSAEEMLALVNNIQDQHYSDPDERDAMFGTLDAAGVIAGYETRRVTRSGDVIWVLLNMRALRDASGAVFRYEGFCMDISKRKRVEAALAHQERQLRVIFDNSPLGLVYFDSQGAVIKCNARFWSWSAPRPSGWRASASSRCCPIRSGRPWPRPCTANRPWPKGRIRPSTAVTASMPGRCSILWSWELRLRGHCHRGGHRRRPGTGSLPASVVGGGGGLAASIVITDAQGNIEYVNPHFTALTGYTPDEARGRNPSVLKSGIHEDVFYGRCGKPWPLAGSGAESFATEEKRRALLGGFLHLAHPGRNRGHHPLYGGQGRHHRAQGTGENP